MNAMIRIFPIIALLLLAVGLSGCVTPQDLYPYDERIYRLEQQVQQQNSAIKNSRDQFSAYRDDAQQMRNQSASLTATLDAMRQETRQLNGEIEELTHRLNRELGTSGQNQTRYSMRVEQLEAALADYKNRIEYLEQYLNIERTAAEKVPDRPTSDDSVASQQPSSPPAPASEAELYQQAKGAFDSGNDETARELFGSFLKQYPKSKNADNAQFWIAEVFYREQWYEKAILEYQKVIEKYPKGNKAPDAMLKQGLAFYKLGDKANARLILKELVKKYPKTKAAQIAGTKIKEL